MASTPVSNVAPQATDTAPPADGQEQFDAAVQQALISGGSTLLAQEMMKLAQEMLNEEVPGAEE